MQYLIGCRKMLYKVGECIYLKTREILILLKVTVRFFWLPVALTNIICYVRE